MSDPADTCGRNVGMSCVGWAACMASASSQGARTEGKRRKGGKGGYSEALNSTGWISAWQGFTYPSF